MAELVRQNRILRAQATDAVAQTRRALQDYLRVANAHLVMAADIIACSQLSMKTADCLSSQEEVERRYQRGQDAPVPAATFQRLALRRVSAAGNSSPAETDPRPIEVG